jgi:hypothetical protein
MYHEYGARQPRASLAVPTLAPQLVRKRRRGRVWRTAARKCRQTGDAVFKRVGCGVLHVWLKRRSTSTYMKRRQTTARRSRPAPERQSAHAQTTTGVGIWNGAAGSDEERRRSELPTRCAKELDGQVGSDAFSDDVIVGPYVAC